MCWNNPTHATIERACEQNHPLSSLAIFSPGSLTRAAMSGSFPKLLFRSVVPLDVHPSHSDSLAIRLRTGKTAPVYNLLFDQLQSFLEMRSIEMDGMEERRRCSAPIGLYDVRACQQTHSQ
jgi:hypothetical protein